MSKVAATKKVWLSAVLIYLICFAFRLIEYFVIRTDESFFGEAFIHKLLGIAVLFVSAKLLCYSMGELGFTKRHAARNIL